MMLNLNSVLNRQVPQNKSLGFGISSARLKELMNTYKMYPSITPIANNQWSSTLAIGGDYQVFCNNTPIQVTYRNQNELLPKMANSIPVGSKLQKVQFLTIA